MLYACTDCVTPLRTDCLHGRLTRFTRNGNIAIYYIGLGTQLLPSPCPISRPFVCYSLDLFSPPHDGYVHDGQGPADDNSPVRDVLRDAHGHASRQRHNFHLQRQRQGQGQTQTQTQRCLVQVDTTSNCKDTDKDKVKDREREVRDVWFKRRETCVDMTSRPKA